MLVCKGLKNITVIGLGLLGGSLGLAIDSVLPHVRRLGWSHRKQTRDKALSLDTVDEVFDELADSVKDADLVILASPIGTFSEQFKVIAPVLKPGAVITDVGSTKVLPVRWARQSLSREVHFVGSHPMAGSEQQGVDYARADLFQDANCILTPTPKSSPEAVALLWEFWELLGMRVSEMTPSIHDRVVGNISHLPHVLAMALINISMPDQTLFCGKGFLDTTRIASGPANVWRDILMANADNTAKGIDKLISELVAVQTVLKERKSESIYQMLEVARIKRDHLVEQKMKRKELPT